MSDERILRAGPLEVTFRDGDLWHIRLGRTELVERVYVAVRDRNWGTVPGRVEGLTVADRGRSFTLHFDGVHQEGGIGFRWRGTVIGTEAGTLTLFMDGRALTTFLRNRIGFCVHHPLRTTAGRPCLIETASGARRQLRFPDLVAPHQPFLDVRAMRHPAAPGTEVEIRFHGEAFETEDHRNWTDANFKTYGTALALPFPVEVPAGTQISQLVEIRLRGPAPPPPRAVSGPVQVRATGGPLAPLPKLGLGLGGALPENEGALLKRLNLSHLRVDVDLSAAVEPVMERAAAAARLLGVKLEVAITLPGDPAALERWRSLIERWLVFHKSQPSSNAEALRAVRQALGKDAVLAAGTNANFAELNRNRPSGGDWDAACFSINPQVHAFDNESVMANADAQSDAVRTARSFAGGKPVLVTPVTLRPRFNAVATAQTEPPPPDPRQTQPFCAAWTLASLRALAAAGAAAVTYFECSGDAGLLSGERTHPVYGVFLAVGEFAGGSIAASESSDPLAVGSLLLSRGTKRRMLLANRTGKSIRAGFRGAVRELPPYGVETVDWVV